jgi:hypothetical protein
LPTRRNVASKPFGVFPLGFDPGISRRCFAHGPRFFAFRSTPGIRAKKENKLQGFECVKLWLGRLPDSTAIGLINPYHPRTKDLGYLTREFLEQVLMRRPPTLGAAIKLAAERLDYSVRIGGDPKTDTVGYLAWLFTWGDFIKIDDMTFEDYKAFRKPMKKEQ